MLITVLALLVFLIVANRIAGQLCLWAGAVEESEIDSNFVDPTVTVVVPLFNEGTSIRATIRSLLAQDYPEEKLDIIVVDDCSTDGSYLHACREAQGNPRVRVLRNARNVGKRRSINHAVRKATSEIIVSVDSDVVVKDDAVRLMVREFAAPEIAAVGGRVDVVNKNENWLTRMQSIKYFYSYFFSKSLEPAFKSVMCLSGCLTAYRRSVLLELEPILEQRAVLGVPIKYGEDRFLTRQIIKAGYKTTMILGAVCQTKAPTSLDKYFAQQLRWRRSNLVDYGGGLSHVWRLHPAIAIHYFACCAVLLAYNALLLQSIMKGFFWELMTAQLALNAIMGMIYVVKMRNQPAEDRVGPLNILFLGFLTPITYAVLLPLALFTLDSGCWETRGHGKPAMVLPKVPEVTRGLQGVSLAPVIKFRNRRGGEPKAVPHKVYPVASDPAAPKVVKRRRTGTSA